MQRHQQPVNWDHENHREKYVKTHLQSNETDSAFSLAAKPLPRLPRGWARICYETSLLLRGLGLGVVVSAFQGLFSKNFSEPAKIAIRRNRITACLRNLIHTVPLGIALFEIILNWKGRYVGAQVLNPNYLQFAAKAHEVTVQISVATIILSYVRHHVVNKGMPFGAVLAGLQIFQPNYLWSLEFWASMSSKNYQLNRKLPFAFLVLACILVTILAGPSSANLLIARHGIWRTKSAYIAFNATFQDIWPDQLDGEDVPKSCAVANLGSLANDPDCPLSNLLFSLGTSAFEMSQENPSKQLSFVDQNSTLGFIKQMTVASCSSSPKDQFCASSSQEVILGGLVIDSFSQPQFKDRTSCIDGYQRIQEGYYQPYTAATCVSDVIKKSSGQEPLRFPRLSETESELSHDREIISVSDITKGQAMQISGNISQYLVNWVDLPQNLSNGMPGVVIIHPHNPGQSLVNITACTLAAGWGTSEVSTHFQDLEKMYSQMIDIPSSWGIHDNVVDTYGYVKRSWPDFGTRSNFSYPQRRINISRKWAEFLDPTIILPDNSNSTSISLFLTELQSSPSEDDVARILSATFASGLSMVGLKYDWEGEFITNKFQSNSANVSKFFKIYRQPQQLCVILVSF